jgi:hypothetical protein
MTTDATTQLIQRVLNQLSSTGAPAPNSNGNLLSQADSVIGTAANYAQILSTAAGPIAQAAVAPTISSIAAQAAASTAVVSGAETTATAEASALGALAQGDIAALAAAATAEAAVASAGIAAGIVLIVSFVLAALSASGGSDSTETQTLQQLNAEAQGIGDVALAQYWGGKTGDIVSLWNSATGGLGIDLDDLAAYGISTQGPGGDYVKQDAGQYHENALAFLDNLTKTGSEQYWERPVVPTQLFTSQPVPYPWDFTGWTMGWYGNLPQPLPGPPLGGQSSQMALDPRSMIPFLSVGLQSYLTLATVVNFIDASQTFSGFVEGSLEDYASFLYSQYQLAVNGILKSDIPSYWDVLNFLNYATDGWIPGLGSFGPGSAFESNYFPPTLFPGQSPPQTGDAWNGVYGAVDQYPQYGVYQPSTPVPVPASLASCLIDIINTENVRSELMAGVSLPEETYLEEATLIDWIYPWVQNKLILGRMARWKAIYLMNGYDKVWSLLQNAYAVVNPNQPPLPAMTLDQDGTIADGNWSARELCDVLNLNGDIAAFVQEGSLPVDGPVSAYSLFSLVQVLNTIATGNWTGPGGYVETTPLQGLSRPARFRERLAAAAVVFS